MSEFHFLRPWWFLALIPALLILAVLLRSRAEGSAWQAVFDRQLLERLWLEPPGALSRLPLLLLGLGWLLAILALVGPVWERQPEPVWRSQASRILILDLSASMDAADLAPTRLERARFKIMDILAKTRDGRTGLVVFAGEPHIVTPLTEDGDTIANLLSALSTDIVPAAGDAGAPALQMAGDLLEQAGVAHGDLLLLSDGLSDPAAALGVVRNLRDRGHRLSVLGVGTAQGAPIPRSDGGFAGMARLPAAPLKELARAGGGVFSLLTADDRDLGSVLLEPHRSTPLQEVQDSGVERWIEQGAWLLPLLLLLGAAGFRRGWLAGILAIVVMPPPAQAFEWRDLWLRPDQQAASALDQGQPEVAAHRFVDPAWRGMALYQAGDYSGAAQAFADSKGVEAGYNRGNALARAGQLDEAAEAYREVLEQAPEHADAKANLALVEKLQQQQPQQQQDQPRGSQEEDAAQQQQTQQQQQSQSGEDKEQQAGGDPGDQSSGEDGEEEGPAEIEKEQGWADAGGEPVEEPAQQTDPGTGSEEQTMRPGQEQEDSMESARRDVADQARPQGRSNEEERPPEGLASKDGEPPSEADVALDQWLRQIPEDPAGLLRRKFMLEHLRRQQERE